MIKVLHCVSNMDRAGIETMLMNYYRNINKEKIQFYFLCNKSKEGSYNDEIKRLGGKIFVSPGLNPLKCIKYHKFVKEIIKENKIDIIHVHNGAFGLQSLIAAKSAGVKIRISHAHGTQIDKNYKLPLKLLYKSFLTKYANNYWGCCKEAIEYYFREKANKNNSYLLNNAINLENFKYSNENRIKIRKELGIKEDEILIGHVGRFMIQKNHEYIIELFKYIYNKNKKVKLVLIGDGELLSTFKTKVKLYNLDDNIIFKNNIPNVNEYYSAMDIFILPSLFEGLPVVGIEAQANGLNCIMSNTISNEVNIIGKVKFLNIQKNNYKEWMENIIKLSKKRNDNIKELKENGYSIKIESEKLEKKYEKMLESEK